MHSFIFDDIGSELCLFFLNLYLLRFIPVLYTWYRWRNISFFLWSFVVLAGIINFALGLYYFYWKMVNYWKSKVLPKIKKVFENPKKAAAAEACKNFDEAKVIVCRLQIVKGVSKESWLSIIDQEGGKSSIDYILSIFVDSLEIVVACIDVLLNWSGTIRKGVWRQKDWASTQSYWNLWSFLNWD